MPSMRVRETPSRPTVIYDGRCRICTASADRIRRLDVRGELALLSLHEPAVAARFPEIRREDVLESMHVVLPDGAVRRGADAVREVLRHLPRARWLGILWLVPGFSWLARHGYSWVARNRYRFDRTIACDGDVCRVHR